MRETVSNILIFYNTAENHPDSDTYLSTEYRSPLFTDTDILITTALRVIKGQ